MTITGDGLFLGLLFLGVVLMVFSAKRPNILLALATFMVWFSLGFWLFFSTSAPIGFGEVWQDILGWCFLVISFLPWVFQMDVEIKHEAEGHSWSTWGKEPKVSEPSEYAAYREKLYARTRKGRARQRG